MGSITLSAPTDAGVCIWADLGNSNGSSVVKVQIKVISKKAGIGCHSVGGQDLNSEKNNCCTCGPMIKR